MTTIEDLFPGKMGKVELTRVAIRLRMPRLMRAPPKKQLDPALVEQITTALIEVRKG